MPIGAAWAGRSLEREREREASSKKSRQFQKSGGKCLRRACRWDLFTCERTTISRVVDVRLSALSRCTQRYSVNRVFRAAVVVAAVVVFAGPTAAADPLPPPNDNRANATPLHPPATIRGTTVGATNEKNDPRPSCGPVESTVWYRTSDAPSGRTI